MFYDKQQRSTISANCAKLTEHFIDWRRRASSLNAAVSSRITVRNSPIKRLYVYQLPANDASVYLLFCFLTAIGLG